MAEVPVAIRVSNTLTQKKEAFEPGIPGLVRMYACGVTVYDRCHIGHARQALVFEVIRRYLEFRGYRVTYVRNFTDIDDKIIARAQQLGVSWDAVASRYITAYHRDMDALGLRRADGEPRASDHIGDMIGIIQGLLGRGYAYRVDGDVYFEVRRFAEYGKLSHRNLDDLVAGARVEVDPRKRDPLDFALWKASKPGEPAWASPWGPGRPGWHIECSAMSVKYLGESFDIHGGGEDLIFPHHENEIAQSEAGSGRPLARYWVHNGFVRMDREKMSKSLGNILALEDLLARHTPDEVKLFLLSAHYRSPLDFSPRKLVEAGKALQRLVGVLRDVGELSARFPGPEADRWGPADEVKAAFIQAMDDDFNTPLALGQLFELATEMNRLLGSLPDGKDPEGSGLPALRAGADVIRQLGGVLALSLDVPTVARLIDDPMDAAEALASLREALGQSASGVSEAEALRQRAAQLAVHVVSARERARQSRDWKAADGIRAGLGSLALRIEDLPGVVRVATDVAAAVRQGLPADRRIAVTVLK